MPAARAALRELDALPHDRVRGDPVEERELVEPEPQRRQRPGVELVDRARELLDEVVERQPPLDGPERELHRQRPLARIEVLRLAVQRAVGVRALLEDAPDDGEGDAARRRDAAHGLR